ncbi:hypothetical protein Bbelb_444220 [Branchiostoma belcheri]|nr:hypothetical protein Bbelb_444220 [Branchiostoma belcheri]
MFAGDRLDDLGHTKVNELMWYPDGSGLLFNHTEGKTVRADRPNVFGIKRIENKTICPVKGLETYWDICKKLGLCILTGYVFRSTSVKGEVTENPFSSGAAEARLRIHLKAAGLYEGESGHSFRTGCALTLAFAGSSKQDIMAHVGWFAEPSAEHYMRLTKVLKANSPAGNMAAALNMTGGDGAAVTSLIQLYKDLNDLKGFVPVCEKAV